MSKSIVRVTNINNNEEHHFESDTLAKASINQTYSSSNKKVTYRYANTIDRERYDILVDNAVELTVTPIMVYGHVEHL